MLRVVGDVTVRAVDGLLSIVSNTNSSVRWDFEHVISGQPSATSCAFFGAPCLLRSRNCNGAPVYHSAL